MLIFQSATISKCWLPRKVIQCSMYSTMIANVLIKTGWDRMKNVGGVAFWHFRPHMILCQQTFQSALKILVFGRSQKRYNSLFCTMTNIYIIKFGWNWTETVGEVHVTFWNFSSHRFHMFHVNENEKNCHKNLKFERKENSLEIWQVGSFP